ncbi:MAG: hypothetical protein LZF60_270069 [Nitrospira sp.]|nr:MAG: hypothetical protein LZF60_270069 [Nitrospira sp.]
MSLEGYWYAPTEEVLDVLREILTAYSASASKHSASDVPLEAVRKVATRELAAHRFSNYDSAERSIHDACTRRLRLNAEAFDERVVRWLSGDLRRTARRFKRSEWLLQRPRCSRVVT